MTGPRRRAPRWVADLHRKQDGLAAGAEALVFGVLVFVVGSIIVLNGWAVLDAHFAVNAAAREATRTIVEAGGVTRTPMVGASGSRVEAGAVHDVAAETMAGHGKDPSMLDDPGDFVVTLVDDPWPGDTGTPERCARVTVQVHYPVQGIRLPILGGWQAPVRVEGLHTELIDPLRSGLAGRADCG